MLALSKQFSHSMLIDTHAHVNFSAFRDDAGEVIRQSLENDVWIINVGSQYTTSKRAVNFAQQYDQGVYAAVGLHPIYAEEKFNYEKFKALAKSPKVVAIGEIGLDYESKYISFKEKQKEILFEQINLAKELNLPIIFHCRMAHDDLIEILNSKSQIQNSKLRGVIHCFTGTWQEAKQYMELGLYLGFNGLIFKINFDEIIKKTPLEKILIETDCPYLTPPQEGEKRNEPVYIKYIAEKIAKIKKLSYEEITNTTTKNAKKLFDF